MACMQVSICKWDSMPADRTGLGIFEPFFGALEGTHLNHLTCPAFPLFPASREYHARAPVVCLFSRAFSAYLLSTGSRVPFLQLEVQLLTVRIKKGMGEG